MNARSKESPEKEFPAADVFEGNGGADGGRESAGADDDGAPVGVDCRARLLEDGDDVHCLPGGGGVYIRGWWLRTVCFTAFMGQLQRWKLQGRQEAQNELQN